jgi:predicted esterase YcpF (UPF0227 family)
MIKLLKYHQDEINITSHFVFEYNIDYELVIPTNPLLEVDLLISIKDNKLLFFLKETIDENLYCNNTINKLKEFYKFLINNLNHNINI